MFQLIDTPPVTFGIDAKGARLECVAPNIGDRELYEMFSSGTAAACMARFVASWNVKTPAGEPAPVTPLLMARVLDQLGDDAVKRLQEAYIAARNEARAGN